MVLKLSTNADQQLPNLLMWYSPALRPVGVKLRRSGMSKLSPFLDRERTLVGRELAPTPPATITSFAGRACPAFGTRALF
jgi:hypothetical protein